MALLTNLLPALRDLRSPLAGGAVWALFLYLLAFPSRHGIRESAPDVVEALLLVEKALGATALVALPVAFYILGIAAESIVGATARTFARPLRRTVRSGRSAYQTSRDALSSWEGLSRRIFTRSTALRLRLRPISEEGISRIALIKARLLPLSVAPEFPNVAVIQDAQATSLRLSHDNNEQFQQIDRIRAESEFRLAVATPLAAMFILVGVENWLFLIGLLMPAILYWQGLQSLRKANNLLWTSAYLGYCDPPILMAAKESYDGWKGSLGYDLAETPPEVRRDLEANWLIHFLGSAGVNHQIATDVVRDVIGRRVAAQQSVSYGAIPPALQVKDW